MARAAERQAAAVRRQLAGLRAGLRTRSNADYSRYAADPCGYARDVLGVSWWAKQQQIAEGLTTYPYRVLVKASHSVGKSHLAGGLINWWYDAHDPGVCLTTAPTIRQVRDILWKEVRRQRRGRPGFPGPKLPRLESAPDHFASGLTATDATAFQGQHEKSVLLVFDEAVGVDREFWEAAESMFMGAHCAWLAIFNPTDSSSQAYAEEQATDRDGNPKWRVIDIPATDHPNIEAELAGRPAPYPAAVRLDWLEARLAEWCEPIAPADARATDIQWPPQSGRWLRPGPLAEARLLARWPSVAEGVWSDALWAAAETTLVIPPADVLPQLGADIARFGDDLTEFHVRCGGVSLHHEAHNGWDTAQTAGRLKQLCQEWAAWHDARHAPSRQPTDPKRILCAVDDDGVGGGVVDQAGGYNFVGVGAGTVSSDPDNYHRRRDELWFTVAERARAGRLSFARLPEDVRRRLKLQALAPRWKVDADGSRVVEKKAETKKRIGRSPDGMDAVNLAYAEVGQSVGRFVAQDKKPMLADQGGAAARRKLFGRK